MGEKDNELLLSIESQDEISSIENYILVLLCPYINVFFSLQQILPFPNHPKTKIYTNWDTIYSILGEMSGRGTWCQGMEVLMLGSGRSC